MRLQGALNKLLGERVGVCVLDGRGANAGEHVGCFCAVKDAVDGGGVGLEEAGGREEGEVLFAHSEHVGAREEALDPEVAVGGEAVTHLVGGGVEGGGAERSEVLGFEQAVIGEKGVDGNVVGEGGGGLDSGGHFGSVFWEWLLVGMGSYGADRKLSSTCIAVMEQEGEEDAIGKVTMDGSITKEEKRRRLSIDIYSTYICAQDINTSSQASLRTPFPRPAYRLAADSRRHKQASTQLITPG